MSFSFHVPSIHWPFKKKGSTEPNVASSPAPAVLSPEAEALTNKTLAQLVDDKLEQFDSNDLLVIKINRQGLLVWIGIILLAIWLTPAARFGIEKIKSHEAVIPKIAWPFAKRVVPAASPLPSPSIVEATPSGIRVRMGSTASSSAQAVKKLLTANGYNQVDLVYDSTVNPNEVLIATHSDTNDLGQRLTTLFAKSYKTASSSALLTEDSDFAATILVGKNALRRK